MSEVVGIRPDQAVAIKEPNHNAIMVLEDILSRAKAGEVIGVAIAAYHPGGSTSWQIGGIHGRGTIGVMEIMKADLVLRDLEDQV